jgi:hypothetical protein
MASFTTRVELHKATEEDYLALHTAMEIEGFTRTIEGSDGKLYQLPTAEYNRVDDGLTKEQVMEDAKSAASSTGREYWILVTESKARTWVLNEAR